jgi:uncharacterized membrane protein YfcA
VPLLVLGLAYGQEATGTSLAAIIVIGVLSPLGVLAGVALANAVSERTLELSFAAMQLVFAWQLAGKAGLR